MIATFRQIMSVHAQIHLEEPRQAVNSRVSACALILGRSSIESLPCRKGQSTNQRKDAPKPYISHNFLGNDLVMIYDSIS